MDAISLSTEEETPVQLSTREARQVAILTELPCVLPFSQRVRIFYSLVQEDRRSQQGSFENQHMYSAIRMRVRRSHLYEDAFEKLSKDNGKFLSSCDMCTCKTLPVFFIICM